MIIERSDATVDLMEEAIDGVEVVEGFKKNTAADTPGYIPVSRYVREGDTDVFQSYIDGKSNGLIHTTALADRMFRRIERGGWIYKLDDERLSIAAEETKKEEK